MAATLACVKAGVTTGEWAGALREVFGEYRGPTGLSATTSASAGSGLEGVRARVRETAAALGAGRLRMLVGKPGLDGHSNGAEQIAVRARDVGMEVVYEGIRLTPAQIAASALQEGVHVVGLSILSGSHRELIPAVMEALRRAHAAGGSGGVEAPVVVGGIEGDPRAVAQQRAARAPRGRVDGEHRDAAPVCPPRAHELAQERRLARAGRPGDPDDVRARLAAQGGGGDLAQQRSHLLVRAAGLDEVEHRGRRSQVAVAQASPQRRRRRRHADALASRRSLAPWRSATSATMSRMIRVRSKSFGV